MEWPVKHGLDFPPADGKLQVARRPGPGRLRRCRAELGLRFPPGLMTEGLAHGEAFRLSAPSLTQIRHQCVNPREKLIKCAVILQPIVEVQTLELDLGLVLLAG